MTTEPWLLEPRWGYLQRKFVLTNYYLRSAKRLVAAEKTRHYSGQAPETLLGLLSEILDILTDRLDQHAVGLGMIAGGLPGGRTPETLEWGLQAIANASMDLIELIDETRAADVESVPWGLVNYLERHCDQIDKRLIVLIRPWALFNYGHLDLNTWLLDKRESWLDDKMIQLLDELPTIQILSFPISERHNILLHAAMGHEIGHGLDKLLAEEENLEYDARKFTTLDHPKLSYYFASTIHVDEHSHPFEYYFRRHWPEYDRREQLSEAEDKFLETALRHSLAGWLREYICDLLAVRLFGPAALFALAETACAVKTLSEPGRNGSYPPPVSRLQVMLDELEVQGFFGEDDVTRWLVDEHHDYGSFIVREKNHIRELCRRFQFEILSEGFEGRGRDTPQRAYDELIYYTIMNGPLDSVRSYVRGLEREGYFIRPESLRSDVLALVQYLQQNAPPNYPIVSNDQQSTPLSSILNASWIYWLFVRETCLDENPDPLASSLLEEHERINQFALKAIESSAYQLEKLPMTPLEPIDSEPEL